MMFQSCLTKSLIIIIVCSIKTYKFLLGTFKPGTHASKFHRHFKS